MTPSLPARPLALLLSTALLLAACGSTTVSPAPTPSATPSATATPAPTTDPTPDASAGDAADYDRINAQVQAIRGLDERKPVEPRIVSEAELAAVIRESLDKDYPAEMVAADERLYQGLGLLARDQKLADIFVDLLESQVAGVYDPSSESLYVLSRAGGVGPVEKVFYSHEYQHALQDQHFDLEAFQEGLEGQTDAQLARQALVEGDAYVLMAYWLQQNLTPAELATVISEANDPEAIAALDRIPPIVQAQILFAATQGLQWALGQQMAGGWDAIDAAFADPPVSTEQILHPEKWESREAPVEVTLPDDLAERLGAGWSVGLENTMGEHQTGIWLGDSGAPAAVGWGGDRIALLDGPDDAWAIVWKTAWDTPADATEFEATAKAAVQSAGGPGDVLPGDGDATRWVVIGSDDATLGAVEGVLGLAG